MNDENDNEVLHPVTGLPTGRLIEKQLRRIIRIKGSSLLDLRIDYFEQFKSVYGSPAGDEVLLFTAILLGEVIEEVGTPTDFIAHAGEDNFVIVTTSACAPKIRERVKARFNEEVLTLYSSEDRQRSYLSVHDHEGNERRIPPMKIAVGEISADSRFLKNGE